MPQLTLRLLPDRLAVCRFDAGDAAPEWAARASGFTSVTRTVDELSVVCSEDAVPAGVKSEAGWSLFKIEGPFAFTQTGILVAAAAPLAEAGIPIFAISTFDTDYILVKREHAARSVEVLESAGHRLLI
jgi:uncharacterized protein